jgi:branched-chain amino acid transport system permease protein
MIVFVTTIIAGLSTAAIYALAALGFSFIYACSRVINFAQGAWMVLAGLCASSVASGRLGIAGAVVIGPLVGAALGLTGYLFFTAWLRSGDVLSMALSLLGMSIIIEGVALYGWGTNPFGIPAISTLSPIHAGGVIITWATIISIATALVLIAVISTVLSKTRMGRAIVATAVNGEAAELAGISRRLVLAISFTASGLLAGIAGLLVAAVSTVQYLSGLELTVAGFTAAAVGGLTRPVGAVIGALIVGMAEEIATTYGGGANGDLITLLLSLAILLIFAKRLRGPRLRPEEEASGLSHEVA